MAELLIGCGRRLGKLIATFGRSEWTNLTTLDINPNHCPDVEWDLTRLPMPFPEGAFDEIHAYEVLEHTGAQGDYRFFAQFAEFWRILRTGGAFVATVPAFGSRWMWGDPSHTRIIQPESLIFLDQTEYARRVGLTPMSDFRHLWRADFLTERAHEQDGTFTFVLRAIKPARVDG